MPTSVEIRQQFLDFFESKGHKIVPSAPIVIKNDPTLMFTNAGMNPFKDFFLGLGTPPHPRVADTQKCLRVSGKHNDLEEVGHDTYHHTMFEMLGNWSFGDYFKADAIAWAWELLTEVYKIDENRLYVTVFGGDEKDGLPRDNDASAEWEKWIAKDRILNGSKKDNFWEMGDAGPCGPCSEIHIDLRPDNQRAKTPGDALVNSDHPQVVEVWNLVFMEFNRKANGNLEKLPAQHVDTGMGFERLCMALQGKTSNYDTDVFMPLIAKMEAICGKQYGKDEKTDIAFRVVADHIRAVAFAIADGQLPSNNGAGYVIRRILRRAIRYGFTFLETQEPFMFKLVEVLQTQMGPFFQEIKSQGNLVSKVLKEEEQGFLRTLEQGLHRLEQTTRALGGDVFPGETAFELYDTFGFPLDLTRLILKEKNIELDETGFEREMQAQKNRSRAATALQTDDWVTVRPLVDETFTGYDSLSDDVQILQYRKVIQAGRTYFQLLLDKTPFYPEGGGQVGDVGDLQGENEVVHIFDTKKENGRIVHFAERLPQDVEATFTVKVNQAARAATRKNHTATHLLHQALREVLGTHVEQKGSLVTPGYLRFDFSHFQKVSAEELEKVEAFVNVRIRENLPLEEFRNIPHQEALAKGAIALFGEKYGDTVRAIKFGGSTELCGGTHVGATGEIALFVITSEGAVAAGVRRIEAITGDTAYRYMREKMAQLDEIASFVKNPKNPLASIQTLKEENATLQKELETLRTQKAQLLKKELLDNVQEVGGFSLIAKTVDLNAAAIKSLCFELKSEPGRVIVLGLQEGGKVLLSVAVSDDVASAGIKANDWIKNFAPMIQGGGGGQPIFATAGGKNPDGLERVYNEAHNLLLSAQKA